MAYTSSAETAKKGSLFGYMANPVIRKMARKGDFASQNTATYGGIAGKTVCFLLLTAAAVFISFMLHNWFIANGADIQHFEDTEKGIFDIVFTTPEAVMVGAALLISIIVPFLAWLIRKAIPIVGTLYCLAQGIIIGYITIWLAPEYKYISLLAMLITMALVGVLLLFYTKRIITITARFKGVVCAMFLGAIISGVIYFLLSLIPAVRNSGIFAGISNALNNPVVSIIISIAFVVFASLFMLADFTTIEECVENQIDKKYEWMAAWGLAYTVLFIYFKILRILLTITGSSKRSN